MNGVQEICARLALKRGEEISSIEQRMAPDCVYGGDGPAKADWQRRNRLAREVRVLKLLYEIAGDLGAGR
ncbi:hypothetical protein [Pararhizobium sp.]|uniref:hypothetical protein n=1 Tax=Pararhizobium sp. TaxID=1977563 RepID=UPI003D0D5D74